MSSGKQRLLAAAAPAEHQAAGSGNGRARRDATNTMRASRSLLITHVPSGEAPLSVRQQWVGLVLPLAPAHARVRTAPTFGVLTAPRSTLARLVGILRGQSVRKRGYAVESARAIEVLHSAHPEAAAWWRANAPHMLRPGRYFLFDEDSGHLVGG